MRLVIQRVTEARVVVNESTSGEIGKGFLVFLGIARGDSTADADYLAEKLLGLRVFPDENGKMNLGISEIGGSILLVSQFTLYGDCRRGRRPSFDRAMPPNDAGPVYDYFLDTLKKGPVPVETGVFQASMRVHLVNDGPVTIIIDSEEKRQPR